MSREIKFRFFRQNPTPKMIYPECDFLINHLGTPMGIVRYPKDKIEVSEIDVLPLQFTGLKDADYVDIYEGDILDYTVFDFNDNDTQFKGVVRWFGSGFIVTQIPDKLCNGDYGLELFWVCNQDCELRVIGNIHQNKDLIS